MLAANPTWVCQGTPEGVVQETTAEVLARFPAAVALNPQTIVIEVGTWDLNELASDIGTAPCQGQEPTPCQNIQSMITAAQAAGIDVVVCTPPPWGVGPLATDNGSQVADDQHEQDMSAFNINIIGMGDTSTPSVSPVDMYALLAEPIDDFPGGMCDTDCDVYLPGYTVDGVDPSAAGGTVMTQAVQTAIAAVSQPASVRKAAWKKMMDAALARQAEQAQRRVK
jgi:hypothetical protein